MESDIIFPCRELKFYSKIHVFKLKNCITIGSSCCVPAVMSLIGIHEDEGWIPGLAQWVGDPALPGAMV